MSNGEVNRTLRVLGKAWLTPLGKSLIRSQVESMARFARGIDT